MSSIDVCYFRVSKKDETIQDIDSQIEAVISKFKLKDPVIFKERGSAYKVDNLKNRSEFLNLIDLLFDSKSTTIEDLFLGNVEAKEVNLYVWDYHRLMRNFEFSILLGQLFDLFSVNVYTYNKGKVERKDKETPIDKISRYIFYALESYSNEDYSKKIGDNVKKTIKDYNGIKISTKNNKRKKWGMPFKNLEGERVKVSLKVISEMNQKIDELIVYYQDRKFTGFYPLIIKKIREDFGLDPSPAYLTKRRQMLNG